VSLLLTVKVRPGASGRRITMDPDGTLKIYLTSPPDGGKANRELLKYLSKKIGVAKSALIIKRGFKSRQKTLLIDGFEEADSMGLIEKLSG